MATPSPFSSRFGTPERTAFSGRFDSTGVAQSAFSGRFTPDTTAVSPRENFLVSMAREFGRDIEGGFNVATAGAGELLNFLGANVPTTFDDLQQRDIRGAMMLMALGVGGVAGGAARGLPLISRIGAAGEGISGAVGRAAATTTSEAAAGAAFGLIRPLSTDETRGGAILSDAAFTGAFGAGASMMKSAIKGTLGAKVAQLKRARAQSAAAKAIQNAEAEAAVRQSAGVTLLNPSNNNKIVVRRKADGSIQRMFISEGGSTTRETLETDFGSALASAVSDGFTENIGPFQRKLFKSVEGSLDQDSLNLIEEAGGDIVEAMGEVRLGEYAAVREVADSMRQAGRELGDLAGEVVVPSGQLGAPNLQPQARRTLIEELRSSNPTKNLTEMSDADLLREGFRAGIVSIKDLEAGAAVQGVARELVLNSKLPKADLLEVNRHQDLVFKSILPGRRIAKTFPVVKPIFDDLDNRLAGLDNSMQEATAWLHDLKTTVANPAKVKRAVQIVDESAEAGDVEAARQLARENARATGDEEIITFVDRVTDKLGEYLERSKEAGLLKNGRSGYFPMVNANKWRLEIKGMSAEEVAEAGEKLFYSTKQEAAEAVAKLKKINPDIQGQVSPRGFWFEGSSMVEVDPAKLGRLKKTMEEAFTEVVGEAPEPGLLDELLQGKVRPAVPGKKSAGAFKERRLGIRNFSEDPYDALQIYIGTVERALALSDFEQKAQAVMRQIPDSQSSLKAWTQQLVDDALGRPRWFERQFDSVLEFLGVDAKPRALKRLSAAGKKWEAFSRLGGPWSAAVNLTQIPLNTNTVLGPKWTAKGMEVFFPKKYHEVQRIFRENDFHIGHFVPLDLEGTFKSAAGPKAAFKEKRFGEAFHRMAMFMFNGAEKTNRLVTAWGAFNKGLSEGMGRKEAVGFAQEVVERTQFNYRLSNTPELLRGPVGSFLFQFKSFVINELDFIASLSKEEFIRFGAAVWGMGGLGLMLNMPGGDIVDQASTLFFDEKLSEAAKRATGSGDPVKRIAARGLIHGLPGLVNVDMTDYVGVGGIQDITSGLFGPGVDDLNTLKDFVTNAAVDWSSAGFLTEETKRSFVQQAMPSAIRRATRGADVMATGEVRNPYTNKLIYRPDDRFRTGIQMAVGAPTLELTRERAMDAVVARTRERYLKARTTFAKEAAQAIRQGNPAEARRIRAEAEASGFPLDDRSIAYWVKELGRTAAERRERRTPKDLRDEMQEYFEATGTTELPQRLR